MTDSSTGGYLSQGIAPLSNAAIEDLIHNVVVGVTGLDPSLVRPRWQPKPPKQPARDVNWCSPGILNRSRIGFPAMVHFDGDAGGSPPADDSVYSWENLDVIASFYGPAAYDYATLFRDGVTVDQNRDELYSAGIKVVGTGDARNVPELINNEWVGRVDLDIQLSIENRRTYPVLNLICGPVTIYTDTGLVFESNP